jgi:hypothetical protein
MGKLLFSSAGVSQGVTLKPILFLQKFMWDKCARQKSRLLSVSIKATSEASEIFDDTVSVCNPLPIAWLFRN